MRFGIREIVFIVLTAAIPVAAWWFVFRPQNVHNAAMMEEIELRQTKLQELNRATATIGDLKIEIAALEKAIEFFRARLPSEKEIDKVLQEVWRLAEANHLTTKSIRTIESRGESVLVDSNGPYAEQPLSMQLEGGFTGFYGFLLALERRPRILRIQEMEVAKQPKGEQGVITAKCRISVFFERGEER